MYILFIVMLLSQCSGKRLPLRVYGGEDADLEAYQYVVRLEIRYTVKMVNGTMIDNQWHLCTASALSSTWALTAAHCITDLESYVDSTDYSSRLVIRYGSVHSLPNDSKTFSYVVLVIPHPMYVFRESALDFYIRNDIGLIKTNPMPLKRFIKISPVDFKTLYGHEAVFGGFGVTTKKNLYNKTIFGQTLSLKSPLQILKVVINKCTKELALGPLLCLGRRCGIMATVCVGDSGGPVIHSTGVVGVSSLGISTIYCKNPTYNTLIDIAGFTCPVGPYVEWIASYVKN